MKELSTNLVVREEWGVVEVENVSRRHHPVLGGTLRSVEPDKVCEVLSDRASLPVVPVSEKRLKGVRPI